MNRVAAHFIVWRISVGPLSCPLPCERPCDWISSPAFQALEEHRRCSPLILDHKPLRTNCQHSRRGESQVTWPWEITATSYYLFSSGVYRGGNESSALLVSGLVRMWPWSNISKGFWVENVTVIGSGTITGNYSSLNSWLGWDILLDAVRKVSVVTHNHRSHCGLFHWPLKW